VFNRPLTPDILWEIGYLAPVWVVLLGGAMVLYARRRTASRAWRIGFVTLLVLLAAEVLSVLASEWLVYEASKGSVIPLMVFRYRLLMIASSLVHALAFVLLTVAILAGRGRPVDGMLTLPPGPREDE
jgi:hypothetical protein